MCIRDSFSEGNPGYDAIFGKGAASVEFLQSSYDAGAASVTFLQSSFDAGVASVDITTDNLTGDELQAIKDTAKQQGLEIAKEIINKVAEDNDLGSIPTELTDGNGITKTFSVSEMVQILHNRAFGAGVEEGSSSFVSQIIFASQQANKVGKQTVVDLSLIHI